MRNLHFESQGTNTYLVYEIGEQDIVDSMSLGMLTNNRINGLSQTIFTQMDNQKFIKYNVSAKVSAEQFLAGTVNRKQLLGVFSGIINALLAAEDYMITPESILMDMNYIFTDVSTCETELICLPLIGSNKGEFNLGMFFRNIMFRTQFDQTENCDHVAQIINYLNSNPVVALNDFKKIIEGLMTPQNSNVNNTVKSEPEILPVKPRQELSQEDRPMNNIPLQQPVEQKKNNENKAPIKQPVVQQPVPKVNNVTNMAVPPRQTDINKNNGVASGESQEKEISFLYLMQHYNKENAAAYKAQKEEKKRAGASNKGQKVQQPPVNNVQKVPQQTASNFGFAIPGQQQAPTAPVVQQPAPQPMPTPQPVVNNAPIQQMPASQPAYTPPVQPQGQPMNFGETTVLGGGKIGETTVLSGELNPQQRPMPHLIREKNNEKIMLDKPVFRIGKERSYVDYFISDNTAVSRSHANIVARDDSYFLMDTNSTNHTFVNGMMIQSNVETKLEHGDKIRLANEGFEFKLY